MGKIADETLLRIAHFSGFWGRFQPFTVTCFARASVNSFAGAAFVTIEPAPIVAPSPTSAGATSITPEPIKAPSPIIERCLFAQS
jgi:hypothetical protein